MIKFIGTETKKGQVRLSFLAGNRISAAVSTWVEREKKLNPILHSPPPEHVNSATRITAELKSMGQQHKRLEKSLSTFIAQLLVRSSSGLIEFHRKDADMGFLMNVGKAIQEEGRTDAAIFL